MEKETKRQHYVPRTYLKHFSVMKGDEYFISSLPKKSPLLTIIKEINIQNLCVENDIYTLTGETKEERQFIESFYNEAVEKDYDKIYDILVDGKKNQVSKDERHTIISTIVTMFYRTASWKNQFNDFMDREIETLYAMCQKMGKDYFMVGDEKVSFAGLTLEEFKKKSKNENRQSQAKTQLRAALGLINERVKFDDIQVIKISDSDNEYITSDNPVQYFNFRKEIVTPPMDPTNILSLVIDNKHKVQLINSHNGTMRHVISRLNMTGEISFLEKLTTNAQTLKFSDRFALGSRSSLESYVKSKHESERELSEEERKNFKPSDALKIRKNISY